MTQSSIETGAGAALASAAGEREAIAAERFARGTLARAALPGAAFVPEDFDSDLSQTSLADADELLKATLDEAMHAVGGTRAFVALVDMASGELALRFTAGEGWTEDVCRRRVNIASNVSAGAHGAANGAGCGERQGITRHVVINGRPYWSGDVLKDPYYIGFFEDVRSEIAVPILVRDGGTIGVINVESEKPDAFDEADARKLVVLARRIATIIAMAEHQLREEALVAVGKDFNSAADLDTLVADVVEQATKILRADDCSLFLMDESSDALELADSHGPLAGQVGQDGRHYKPGEGLTGWVAQHGQALRVGDPRTDPRWKGLFMEAPAGELAAVMAVPVLCQRSRPGVLRVVRRRKGSLYFLPQEFTQAEEDVLVTLAGQLAVAIDRTRLMERLLHAERMAAWGEMSARSAHMIGNTVFGVKGHLNELTHLLETGDWGLEAGNDVQTVAESTPDAETGSESPVPSPRSLQEARELVGNITRGIYRLEQILSEFRDFVLATKLHLAACDINRVLHEVITESFPARGGIDLVLELAPSLPSLPLDEAKIKRAFGELIENSIDFQPEGGSLTIRSRIADKDSIRSISRGRPAGAFVLIDFIDHGPGFSEQDRERAFQPFYTRKAKGMGLGLSIVKGIIEAHGGFIREIGQEEDMSDAHNGAHFVILLPVGE